MGQNRDQNQLSFGPETAARVARLLGRSDTTTEGYLADCEQCLSAYFRTASGDFAEGLPAEIAAHLDRVSHGAAELRSALYALPDELTALVDLHLLGSDVQRRLGHDLEAMIEPLEDLAGVIHGLRERARTEASLSPDGLFDRLLRALGTAYRNHFNLQPKLDPKQPFLSVLRATLASLQDSDKRIADLYLPGAEARLSRVFGGSPSG